MAIMNVQYVYCKTRQQFGKQCVFDFDGPLAVENIEPNLQLRSEFISKNHYHIGSQVSKRCAIHEAQTENPRLMEKGMLHCEGGWPREVNFQDEELTSRFRKRVVKSENWAPSMKNLMTLMEHCVKQNNAVNIYENYFDDMIPSKLVLPFESRVVNTYSDPRPTPVPISNISWSRRGRRIIVSHCSTGFQRASSRDGPVSYLWSIENPVQPLLTLKPKIPCVTMEFSSRHSSLLISGQMTGQVAFWDLRTADFPIAESDHLYSHSDPASIVMWIDTKTHCEFSSASTDGIIKWWDIRRIREPTQTLTMDSARPKATTGISSMSCLPSMGSKFMVGLENGIVIDGSLKAKTDAEKLKVKFKSHSGPVLSVDRNPFIPKIFMTVGDWTSCIWAEDLNESCLLSIESKKDMPTAGCWSKSRVSVFYMIGSTGELEAWDLLSGLNKPVEMLKLGKDPLTRIRPNENGKFIAIGDRIGKVYLVECSQALITNRKNDKAVLTAYLENCKRFERSVDNRLRELRRVERSKGHDSVVHLDKVKIDVTRHMHKKVGDKVENTTSIPVDFDLIESEKEYFTLVQEESKKYGHVASGQNKTKRLHESKVRDHRKRIKHDRKSYKSNEPRKKYEKRDQDMKTEVSSFGSELSEVIGIGEEVMKLNLRSPEVTKIKKRSPKPCKVQLISRICHPEICCMDVNNSVKKGEKLLNETKESSPRKTKETVENISAEDVQHPFTEVTPVQQVDGFRARLEKYYTARMTEVKDFSEEDKTEILKRATARPSTILLETLLAKTKIDKEAARIRSKKWGSRDADKAEATKSLVQAIEVREKINPEDDNALDKMEDVEPGSSLTVQSTRGAKMKQQKLSPREMTSHVQPRRVLTALQVTPKEAFKPLPNLREREYFSSHKDSYEDRMYPGSSAFPPLPRIVLPKLLERPPDPPVGFGYEEGGSNKKMKRKVKSAVIKAEKSRCSNN